LTAYKAMGLNFMTPKVLAKRVLASKRIVVELAQGSGMTGNTIYGVSILEFDENGNRVLSENAKRSQCFHSQAEAYEFYNTCI
jgi:hypothetical protein